MKLQRLIAAGLATSVSLATGVLAGAAGESQTLNIASTIQVPTVEVVMPTDTSVILNPYGMSVTVGEADPTTDSVISPVWNIQSKTASPLQMKLTAAATGSNDDVAVVESKADANEGKSVYMVMAYQFGDEAAEELAVTSTINSSSDSVAPVITSGSEAPGQFAIPADATPVTNMDPEGEDAPVLGVNTFASAVVDGDESTDGTFFSFRMLGKVNGNASGESAWTTDDSVNVALAFTFQPAKIPVSGRYSGSAIALDGTTTTSATVNTSNITLVGAATNESITGITAANSSNSGVCTASVTSNVVTINHAGAGRATVILTVTTSEGNTITVPVDVSATT